MEKFVCQLYLRGTGITKINEVRNEMFIAIKKSLDALPPTKHALDLHILMANYQCLFFFFFFKQALTPVQDLSDVTSSGWIKNDGGDIRPNLMTESTSLCLQRAYQLFLQKSVWKKVWWHSSWPLDIYHCLCM